MMMGEYLQSAWSGWLDFTAAGKLAALFLVSVGYLVLGKKLRGSQGRLVTYGGIMALLCMFPVTAAVFMKYQTLFYDYPWIWSYVPLTAVIALGGTVFLTDQWKPGRGMRTIGRNIVLALLCVGMLVLCGGLGRGGTGAEAAVLGQEESRVVLEQVKDGCGDDFCLWAPREILEYARSLDGGIRLLYGRNMWDKALDAYSYDVYSGELEELYQWMEHLRDYGVEVSGAEIREHVKKAFEMGADCVLLPEMGDNYKGQVEDLAGNVGETGMADAWSVVITRLDGYYLLKKG